MTKKPRVSIVVPCFNDGSYVGRLLEALSKQNFNGIEVVISDAGSSDGTAEIVKSFVGKLQIQLVVSPPKGPGQGRNVGAKQANGEWLLFLDADDDIDDSDFVKTLVSTAEQKGWNSASTIMKLRDGSIVEHLGTYLNYQYTKLLSHTAHPVCGGWCILTRREVFEQAGGFNPKIQFGEDYDYISRVGKHGFGFVEDTFYYLDMRRPREEGVRFAIKCIANEVYRFTHGFNLERNPIKYEFGKHQKRKL